jgi:hypothetical protein
MHYVGRLKTSLQAKELLLRIYEELKFTKRRLTCCSQILNLLSPSFLIKNKVLNHKIQNSANLLTFFTFIWVQTRSSLTFGLNVKFTFGLSNFAFKGSGY